jgi:centromeric protein E
MMGDDLGRAPGIIPRALEDLFSAISKDKDRDYLIRCSFLELYNESINDLLNTEGTGTNLTIVADDPTKGAIIGGLREEVISSVTDGLELIELGNETRQVASTAMNARSSRSHTIFRIVLEATKTEEALERERKLLSEYDDDGMADDDETTFKSFGKVKEKTNTVVSYLNLVDLAGSERQTHTKSERSEELV